MSDGTRLIRISEDLLEQFGTRTERGERITAKWGEPIEVVLNDQDERESVYEPTFTAHTDDRLGLDAWAELEAAIPHKRWSIWLSGDWENGWEAELNAHTLGGQSIAVKTNDSGWCHDPGGIPTAAAALRELAKLLRASKVETGVEK